MLALWLFALGCAAAPVAWGIVEAARREAVQSAGDGGGSASLAGVQFHRGPDLWLAFNLRDARGEFIGRVYWSVGRWKVAAFRNR